MNKSIWWRGVRAIAIAFLLISTTFTNIAPGFADSMSPDASVGISPDAPPSVSTGAPIKPKALSTKEMQKLVSGGLTGNYPEDTAAVVKSLRYAVSLPKNATDKNTAQLDAKYKINAFASRYRRDGDKLRLTSFTTLRTALNSLASYYNSTAKRKVPEKVRDRVLIELDRVELALAQGD
jgi:photosystem II Psb27 protein